MPKPYFYNKNEVINEILRVNHAGEYGAVRIYKGQISTTTLSAGNRSMLNHMLEGEERHLAYFNNQLNLYHTRPTFFLPLWHISGYMLGKISSLIGPKTAMLCTEAVEDIIDEHYKSQKQLLNDIGELSLAQKVEEFRLEELEHKDIAIKNGSINAPFYLTISGIIKTICRIAIWVSKAI